MKLGVGLGALNAGLWLEASAEADRLGFESVWMPEHLVIPKAGTGSPYRGHAHPPVPSHVPIFDVLVYIAAIAMKTSRIRLATGVYNVGLRHPFVTARAVATADRLSGGRVELGIGSSWLKEEWDAVGLDFASRGRRVDEALGVCRRLWSEPEVEHSGEFFRFPATAFEPKPVQQPLPIVVGGDAPASLARAAKFGSGWYPMNHTLEALPASLAKLAELRAAAGGQGRVEVTVHFPVSEASDLERYAAAGIDRVIVSPWKRSSEALEGLKRFAERFIR
jgi:probable F420-dependent oxidoreductase